MSELVSECVCVCVCVLVQDVGYIASVVSMCDGDTDKVHSKKKPMRDATAVKLTLHVCTSSNIRSGTLKTKICHVAGWPKESAPHRTFLSVIQARLPLIVVVFFTNLLMEMLDSSLSRVPFFPLRRTHTITIARG